MDRHPRSAASTKPSSIFHSVNPSDMMGVGIVEWVRKGSHSIARGVVELGFGRLSDAKKSRNRC